MVEVLRMLDVPAIEQVIAVPKISLDGVPQRSVLRRPQKTEQLVEVPTEPGYSRAVIAWGRRVAAAMAEQIVDKFLRVGGEVAEVFQVFVQDRVLQRRMWSRSLTFQFLRVGGGLVEVFKVLSLDSVQQRMWSRSLLFLLVEVSKVFSQARVPHRVDCMTALMMEFKGFFALFCEGKKCGVGSALGVGTECGLYFMDSGGLCRVHGGRRLRV